MRPEALRSLLAESGGEYDCSSTLPDSVAHLRFIGGFQGLDVVWEATLYTLERYCRERCAEGVLPKSFIEIGQPPDGGYRLVVALGVPVIDAPTIEKAIIMIRNYKWLRSGRHEWGTISPIAHG